MLSRFFPPLRRRAFPPSPVCVLALLALSCVAPLRADVSREYQIKAGFLYNFTKFVEWPADRFADAAAPIVIAVWDENPFGDELENIVRGRRVNGRALSVVCVHSSAEAKRAHVVFFSARERIEQRELEALHAAGVLTVGETARFSALGGIVTFTLEADKVRFEIDVAAAGRAGIRISAQLQKLATSVRNSP